MRCLKPHNAKVQAPQKTAVVRELKITPTTKGKIIKTTTLAHDIKKYRLSNSILVYAKKTNFKANKVIFKVLSLGGFSQISTPNLTQAYLAGRNLDRLNLKDDQGVLNYVQLNELQRQKHSFLNPFINCQTEGFMAQTNKMHMKTVFELVYLHFIQAQFSKSAVQRYKTYFKKWLRQDPTA